MSTIAAGVFKKLNVKKQTGQGVIAPGGASTGQSLRRVTSTIDLNKAFYKSAEIRPSMQRSDGRQGVRSVSGQIQGELSVGTYQGFFESVLRQAAQAVVTTGAQTNMTAAVTVAPAGTITRLAGSFFTDGFVVGDLVTSSGWTTTGAANNAHLFIITALTALVMTVYPLDGVAFAAKASGDSVTTVTAGKKTWLPQTGHTRDYWTIEHNFSDVSLSERFVDCVITGFNVKMGSTGMVNVTFPVMGLDMQTGGSAYFTSPTAASSGTVVASANGILILQGLKVGVMTSIDMTVNGNYTAPGGVVGANVDPDIFPGAVDVNGTVTILFDSATYRDMFLNETIAQLAVALTASNVANPAALAINMPTLKFTDANKDDGEKGLTLTMAFTALENTTAGAGQLLSTISVQDTTFT
jgi:hypothetical protein